MAKAMLVCGKIASGKSWYCRSLMEESPALLLSVDEVADRIFDKALGGDHDAAAARIQAYLLDKAAEAVGAGADVILDWGFWTRASRREAEAFFRDRSMETQWHYIDRSEERRVGKECRL